MSLNVHIVSGYVGKDPEVKEGKTSKFGKFSVATDSYAGKDKKGKAQYETVWHTVEVFDTSAEYVEKHISKGDYVEVVGEHKVDTVEKGGDKQYYHKIRAMRVQKVFFKKDEDASNGSDSGDNDEGQEEETSSKSKSKAAAASAGKSSKKSESEDSDSGADDNAFPF